MKTIFTALTLFIVTALSAANYQVEAYYMGTVAPDCHKWFVTMYQVDDHGTKWYQGHATHTTGIGCPPETNFNYQMGDGSLVDFNDLSDNPEMQNALKDWEQSLALESFKKQSELGTEPFIYKNAAMQYVLKCQLPDEWQLGNILCFSASGKNVGNFNPKPGSQPDEWILSELSNLPKGVYSLLVPTGLSGEDIKVVKFSIL